jgi:hypothetical protein
MAKQQLYKSDVHTSEMMSPYTRATRSNASTTKTALEILFFPKAHEKS